MMADRAVDELNQKLADRLEPGDYQVQVHVIECRELKAEDLNGLSDPYARQGAGSSEEDASDQEVRVVFSMRYCTLTLGI